MTQTANPQATGGANRFLAPDSATARLFAEASRHIPGGTSRLHYFFRPYPIYVRTASGCRLVDVEGVERLDFLNNMTALIHGHAHPAVNQAIVEQLERGTAYSEPSEGELRLAQLIAARVPTVEQIRFANSGTEAVMLAIKLARAYTGRSRIAKFEGHYHGYYDYVQVSFASTPDDWGPADAPASTPSSGGLAEDVLDQVLVLPYNDRDAVERLLERHGRSLAALVLDPLSQRAGCPEPAPGFLPFLREITRAYGIVLVYDEVISFRIGYHGAQGVYGGEPDLTTFGKIIGGGLPVGAVGGRAEVMALLDPTRGRPAVVSGGTFSGNPLTMAAGRAALELLTPAAFDRLNALGERLRAEANAVFRRTGERGQVVGAGSLFRVLLTDRPIRNYRDSVLDAAPGHPSGTTVPLGTPPPERLARLHLALLDEGVVIANNGLGCLSTPMTDAEVDYFVQALERAILRTR